jgi:hypothetical protein
VSSFYAGDSAQDLSKLDIRSTVHYANAVMAAKVSGNFEIGVFSSLARNDLHCQTVYTDNGKYRCY